MHEVKSITRRIKPEVERELWARAAGRCEFSGCNTLLYRSRVTQEAVHYAEKAHIWAFSKDGPRGRGPFTTDTTGLNEVDNLLLLCPVCHLKIDTEPTRYSAGLLKGWKREHERRVELVTGISPLKQSLVVMYRAPVGDVAAQLTPHDAMEALFPDWYPATSTPVEIGMRWEGRDTDPDYWRMEEAQLGRQFERLQLTGAFDHQHFSLFGFAPIPLLARLGALFTDQVPAEVYQRHREPKQTWRWLPGATETPYQAIPPSNVAGSPVLVLALSDRIALDRVTSVVGEAASIWQLTIPTPENDFLKYPDQLSAYRRALRTLIDEIGRVHGKHVPISIFPAIPVACAVDLGRIRMPKVDAPWEVFDHNRAQNRFVHAITLGGTNG